MRVLMFGWEFPPFFAGGVGMVCYELTRAFSRRDDLQVTYVMPHGPGNISNSHVPIIVANNLISNDRINIKKIPSLLTPYITFEGYQKIRQSFLSNTDEYSDLAADNTARLYGKTLMQEVVRFSEKARILAEHEDFDVIHAHDWTTFPAAIAAREATGKPFIAHVHITEFDKSGGAGVDQRIYNVEKQGLEQADCIIAISHYVKCGLVKNYGIDESKIHVIHNAANTMDTTDYSSEFEIKKHHKVVLFAGRVTLQKGPEYFIDAAKKVCDFRDDVVFVMAGNGDMLPRMIEKAAELGISDRFIFHGFYTRGEAEKLFSMADLFVMPSVSEPFGIVPFESMSKGTPTIISNQSGCSEVLKNCLKVDFWDINEMANLMLSVLEHSALHNTLEEQGLHEMKFVTWNKPAQHCVDLYRKMLKTKNLLERPVKPKQEV